MTGEQGGGQMMMMIMMMMAVNRPSSRSPPPPQLIVRVFDRRTNEELDDPLPFSIIVDDVNDNAPTFVGSLQVTVPENSKAGEENGGWGGGRKHSGLRGGVGC